MAWIESHQALRDHPKTKKAARLLGIGVPQMLGHLHCLWWWALDYAPDGDISDYDSEEIEEAAAWEGEGSLLEAWLACGKAGKPGFLERTEDGGILIHDWYEYAGKLIDKRKADAARKRNERRKDEPKTPDRALEDVREMSDGRPMDVAGNNQQTVPTTPKQTVPNPTQPTIQTAETMRRADGKGTRPTRQSSSELGLVCTGYEQMLGQTLTPGIADALWDWLSDDHYPPAWIVEAMQEAKKASKPDLRYVGGILKNWKTKGKRDDRRNGTGQHHEPTADELRERYAPAEYADVVQS